MALVMGGKAFFGAFTITIMRWRSLDLMITYVLVPPIQTELYSARLDLEVQ